MSSSDIEKPFVLVVGVDNADCESSGFALNQAARIAKRIARSELHVLRVLRADSREENVREAAGALERYIAAKDVELGGLSNQDVGLHVRCGYAGTEISTLANDLEADLIVVGTHRRPHLRALLMGSTAEHVMAAARCPVFVAGPRPAPTTSSVIVIEPPCPDCVLTRQTTSGRQFWCARHSEPHHLGRGHHYSYQSEWPFDSHDSQTGPTGV